MSLQEIQEGILELDVQDRALLAYDLLKSIEDNDNDIDIDEIENLWLDEAEKRADDIGDASKFRNADLVFADAK